jgi:hypothetical protein
MVAFSKCTTSWKIVLELMSGNVVMSEVAALICVVLSKAENHVPYGELVGTAKCIMLETCCPTNQGCYNRVRLYSHLFRHYLFQRRNFKYLCKSLQCKIMVPSRIGTCRLLKRGGGMHILTKSIAKGKTNICLRYMRKEKIVREQIVFIFYANIKIIST